jgi:hypothetical protein
MKIKTLHFFSTGNDMVELDGINLPSKKLILVGTYNKLKPL